MRYDENAKETSQCFDCRVDVQSGFFLCEKCKRQREAEMRFDQNYAMWKAQQQPDESFAMWLVRRREEMGKGEGDEEKGLEGRKE